MMSNYAFWSHSGELFAVHGEGVGLSEGDPRASFAPWAASLRLPPGRLVGLSPGFPLTAVGPGWQLMVPASTRKGRTPRPCDPAAPVAVAAPVRDTVARLLPPFYQHPKFVWKAWPTWVTSVRLEREEGPEGWYAALVEGTKVHRFLIRLIPHRGRLPGEGWRNMLTWVLRDAGLRLVPLQGLPRADALVAAPAWEYRAEAGRGNDAAAWDLQLLPTRAWLLEQAPQTQSPWEATALLRWVRPQAPGAVPSEPGDGEPRWADLLGRWSAADSRLVVQNFLTARPGGAAASAALFYDVVTLPGQDGRNLVRYVPQEGLPVALLSTLFGPRAWHEIERAKRRLPSEAERALARTEAFQELEQRLVERRLVWSDEAEAVWNQLYRVPVKRARERRLRSLRQSARWTDVLGGDPRAPETLLRRLDVTDAALCLRDAPDSRWRRFVTARREAELKAELAFVEQWAARGELSVDRELEAWRAWDEILADLSVVPLTDDAPQN